jgi:hypothetical protein
VQALLERQERRALQAQQGHRVSLGRMVLPVPQALPGRREPQVRRGTLALPVPQGLLVQRAHKE